mmetsp:Transcript_19517/g.36375  ORF Transcript_19517/g.36375 Transcript_19517/m.36375 type:complete len:213 (+) Transcript_19517:147-785(+)
MDSSTPPVEDEVSSPLVFQCLKCNLIVGDSYSFHCANPEQHTISLSAASNIKRVSELFTSFSGSDIGSTYVNFTCSGCQSPLGKYYVTTSSDLDDLREVFTFDANCVASYELGTARHGKLTSESAGSSNKETKNDALMESNAALQDALTNVLTEITKIQHSMCHLDARVESLEVKRLVEEEVAGGIVDEENNSIIGMQKRQRASSPVRAGMD